MGRIVNWLRRVPAWAWLLLVAAHGVAAATAASRASKLAAALAEMPGDGASQPVRDKFRELLWDNQVQMVVAAVLGTLFLGIAAVRLIRRPVAVPGAAKPVGAPDTGRGIR